jgi:hypothetical protein
MGFSIAILAYLGPETVLPVTSAIAGAVGVIMLLGKTSLRRAMMAARSFISLVRRRPEPTARPSRKIGAGPTKRVERHESSQTEV